MIKSVDELSKPSKGEKLLLKLPETPKVEEVITYVQPPKIEESVPEEPEEPTRTPTKDYASFIRDGVEVVDVKAIEKKKGNVDKFGIPIQPGEHKNFDRI